MKDFSDIQLTEEQRELFDFIEKKAIFMKSKKDDGIKRVGIKVKEKEKKILLKIKEMVGGNVNGPYNGFYLWSIKGKMLAERQVAFVEFFIDRREEFVKFMNE